MRIQNQGGAAQGTSSVKVTAQFALDDPRRPRPRTARPGIGPGQQAAVTCIVSGAASESLAFDVTSCYILWRWRRSLIV